MAKKLLDLWWYQNFRNPAYYLHSTIDTIDKVELSFACIAQSLASTGKQWNQNIAAIG